MIHSLVLRTAAGILKPLMILFSVYLLMRGHNDPGGGFAGGLVAAAGFSLDAFARNVTDARRSLRVYPKLLIGIGVLIALGSGVPGLVLDNAFLTGIWYSVPMPVVGTVKVGTPLVFDVGVYLAVIGITLTIVMTLMEGQD